MCEDLNPFCTTLGAERGQAEFHMWNREKAEDTCTWTDDEDFFPLTKWNMLEGQEMK